MTFELLNKDNDFYRVMININGWPHIIDKVSLVEQVRNYSKCTN
jgi:hypothetical protein